MLKNDKRKILILSIIIFCAFALIYLLGNDYVIDYEIMICVNGCAILSLVSFIYSIKFYYDKLKRKKEFLIIGGIINSLIFLIILLFTIVGFIQLSVLYFVIVIVTAFASVNCFKLSKKYLNPKKEKELQEQDIKKAFEKLKTLKMLLDSGAITQEEFDEKRKAYIDLI